MMMIPKLNLNRTAFLLCDIQEKLIPTIKEAGKVIEVAQRLLKVAETLNIPVIVTEQYPKGLGCTVNDLNVKNQAHISIFEKTQFSMLTPQVRSHLQSLQPESVVIFGLESHVCVYQTAKDLLDDAKINVFMAVDGIASRFSEDKVAAIDQLRHWNATISTSESLIFELLRDSKHEKFKEMSALIKSRI